jgi:hypothetical protein
MIRDRLPGLVPTCLLLSACSDDPEGVGQPDSGGAIDLMADTTLFEGGSSMDGPITDAAPSDTALPDAAPDAAQADAAQADAAPSDAVFNPDAIAHKKACDKINADYKFELTKARACNPAMSVIQCDTSVNSALDCPCAVWANKINAAALQKLTTLEAQFKALSCSTLYACPPVPCPSPAQTCIPGGLCANQAS